MDSSQNLFVSDSDAGTIYELPASSNYTTQAALITGLSSPTALTMDQNNNLYVATYSGATVTEYTQSSGYTTGATVASGLAGVWDMSMDAAGNLFVTDTGNNAIKEFYPPNGNSTGAIVDGSIAGPMSVSTAQNGNLYVLANTGYMYELDFADPPSFSYASTDVGSTATPNAPLTISNDGNEALNFTANGLAAPTDYVAADGTTCADSGSLSSNASCELNIDFEPLSAGTLDEYFVLTDNSLNVAGATQSVSVNGTGEATQAAQSITFANPGTQTVGTPLTLAASATSELPVSFASTTPSVCTVADGVATFLASGTCTIDATQAGNGSYAAATMVPQSFTVNGEAQTITFANPGTQTVGTPLTLVASASSELPVSFASATPSVCTVTGSVVTFLASGTCTIDATQAGNGSYAAATMVPQSFTVNAASLSINVAGLAFGNQPVGSTSSTQTVILSNPNGFAVLLSSIAASGDFAATSKCPTIAAGGNCSVNVTFTPSTTGARTGTLTVTDAESSVAQSVPLTGSGTAAGIQVAPTALSFGSEALATTSGGQTVTILNTGTADLTISNVATSGDFAASGNCASVPAGSNCSLTVTFTPTATGARAGALTFSDNVGGQSQTINLLGTGTAAGVSLSPTALAFPGTLVGTASFPATITLTNTGTAALTNLSVSILGDFTQTGTCSSTLAAGASCTISVTYAPTIAGAESGTLTVNDNLGAQTVSLLGTGQAPGASLSTAQLVFGGQLVGTSSLAQTVIFTNSGSAAVQIDSVAPSANFTDTTNCSGTIAAGASCSVNVIFDPAATGSLSGTVTITDDAGTQVVTALGQGVSPGLAVSPSFVLFGAEQTGATSQAQTVTVSNTGTAPLTLNPITVSSSNFAESNQCPSILQPGASCLVSVSFTPTATGSLAGSLVVGDVSGTVSTLVTLGGSGTLPGIAAAPSTLSFGSLPVGAASQAQTVTVSNTGTAPLQIGAITSSGDFAETDTCASTTIAVGGYCVLSVSMTPTTQGTRTGTIQIDNSADGAQLIALSGVGQQAGVSLFPTSLAFGSLPFVSSAQAATTAGTALSVTITNTGTAPLILGSFSTQGDFTESNQCASTVAAGATCSLTVTFVPTALGHRTGTLTITDNAGGGTQVVSLAGDGSPAGLILTPPVLNFGVQTKGVTSQSQTATLTNNTGQAVTDLAITASGEFSETDDCGSSLANGAICTLHITVTPATTGAITGTVTVSAGGSISTDARHAEFQPEITGGSTSSNVGVVALTATAIPPGIGLSIPELSFSVTSVGTPGSGQKLTIQNTGTSLSLTGLTIGETNVAEFPYTTTCTATLAPQATCTITVNFTPTGIGLRAGILNITADGGISAAVPESGTAAQGTPAVTVATSMNPALLGSTVTFTATVSSAAVTPTGTVNFMDGSTLLGSGTLAAGVATFTTSSLAAGPHSITAAYSGDTNFATATSGVLAQVVIDFSVSAASGSGTSETVIPGGTATYSVAIAPTAGSTFPLTTLLTVTGLPAGATATLTTPKTWTQLTSTSWQLPVNTPLSAVSLSFQVPAEAARLGGQQTPLHRLPPVLWGALLLPFAIRLRRAGKRLGQTAAWLLLLAAGVISVAGMSGCGSGNGFFGQAQQSYTVTITVTTGALSHSTNVTLTVE